MGWGVLSNSDFSFLGQVIQYCLLGLKACLLRFASNSEYFLKLHSRYCCCRSIFEEWNIENVLSNMSSSLISSPHNFNFDLIFKSVELYSVTLLKSCSLKLIYSYRALGRITDFWCSYLSLRLFHRIRGSFCYPNINLRGGVI